MLFLSTTCFLTLVLERKIEMEQVHQSTPNDRSWALQARHLNNWFLLKLINTAHLNKVIQLVVFNPTCAFCQDNFSSHTHFTAEIFHSWWSWTKDQPSIDCTSLLPVEGDRCLEFSFKQHCHGNVCELVQCPRTTIGRGNFSCITNEHGWAHAHTRREHPAYPCVHSTYAYSISCSLLVISALWCHGGAPNCCAAKQFVYTSEHFKKNWCLYTLSCNVCCKEAPFGS